MSYQLPVWVWPTGLMAVCAIAVFRGRDDERLAAASCLAAWALSVLLVRVDSSGTAWTGLAIDAALLAIYVWLALRTRRHWPLFTAAFQLLVAATHLGRAADSSVTSWAYMTAGIVWSYLELATIGYGAWTAPHHAANGGGEPNSILRQRDAHFPE